MVVEFAKHGSLLDFLLKQTPNFRTLCSLFRDLIVALQYVHSKNVTHRDVKLDNILIFEEKRKFKAKLGDFGLSSIFK